MTTDRTPAYLWYPGDFETDEAVKLMTYEEEGVYRRLLDHQWVHGSIPAQVELIARIVPKIGVPRFRRIWGALVARFTPHEGRLVNGKLERVRQEIAAFQARQQQAGRASAAARAQRHGTAQPAKRRDVEPEPEPDAEPPPEPDAEPVAEPPVRTAVPTVRRTSPEPSSSSSSSSTDLRTCTSTSGTSIRVLGTYQPVAGKERPMTGTGLARVKVWRSLLDRWLERLGPHADAFDVDAWLQTLDAELADQVLPKDGAAWWAFLDAKLEAEIRRRGLPVAQAPTAPTNKRIAGLVAGTEAFLRLTAAQRQES
jgi:uncharacterized protein YdaU (DUF1376 family)